MYILDSQEFRRRLKEQGYPSIGALAKSLGIHRNTVYHYLSGNGVFPDALEKILLALKLEPTKALKQTGQTAVFKTEAIAPLIDRLHQAFPDVTFVLFGSRTRPKHHKYADWDIGVFSTEGLSHEAFLRIVFAKSELEEDSPYFIDLVNLNRAGKEFLSEISKDWMFLTGKRQDWIELNKKIVT